MAFFEKFGEKITNAGKDVAKKTKELADVTKLNMQINSEEDNIKNKYTEIGKLYYKLFSESPDERFTQMCSSIAESANKINSFKEQIQAIKGVKKCSNCGSEMDDSAQFCSVCGNKILIEEKPVVDEPIQDSSEDAEAVETENASDEACPECDEPVDKD